MSDTTDIATLREQIRIRLERVRLRLREYELDACAVKARVEEARDEEASLEAMLDDTPRRKPGRPRKAEVVDLPDRQPGDSLVMPPRMPEPETEEVA